MPEGEIIGGGALVKDGQNLPLMVEIRLTDLTNMRGSGITGTIVRNDMIKSNAAISSQFSQIQQPEILSLK